MRFVLTYGLSGVFLLFGLITCRSSEQPITEEPSMDNLPNLVETEQPPFSQEVTEQGVSIEDVERVNHEGVDFLLIHGNFPNPCCHLDEVSQSISGNEIQLTLTAWQPADAMCSQVLEPFSYLHPLPDSLDPETGSPLTVSVNNSYFELH